MPPIKIAKKNPKLVSGLNKVRKLLRVGFWGLEKKLCEVPKGKGVVLLDSHYIKVDCGKFKVLVPKKIKKN
jgi:hypothetical protein